ncbi:CmpA/NrtA family ABC transporter substrate-binding protein [uncultured Microbulbifer sp.]|uniref:CmpA/NrtA family ABC transporter substrate-binding protein n=1 Tax=uncultured Microbulbifer sp. TaxID=348147 RepID=UPI002619A29A|nr:CmpA/NrtA family ABC transporter substrate-binding protein [uncultured Microbulbifer sp.]
MSSLQAEKPNLKLLYLRLTDSAPLIVAHELGYFERYGLKVDLQRETSWATLRDKLIGGAADAAAILAPMPLTLNQTLPHCEEPLLSGLILSCNGNAITLSRTLYDSLEITDASDGSQTPDIGAALKSHLQSRAEGEAPLTFASVYPFASHTLQLRHWLTSAGINPDTDVRLVVLPPEQMVDHLRRGDIDGYCVGEPWNTLAVQEGIGVIATPSNALMPAMPEKVLAVTRSWHQANPATHLALRAALLDACGWLSDRSQRRDAIAILARPEYLDLPEATIAASLDDELFATTGQPPVKNPGWHLFAHPQSEHGRPTEKKARELLALCNEIAPTDCAAAEVFNADLYQQTLDFLRHRNLQQTLSA